MIVKFKGIDDINDIEKYKGKSLFVARENAVELEEDEYYIGDLIGMDVYTDESEERFGVLKDVMETGANEVYIVQSERYGEVLLPAIHECILEVDPEEKKNDGTSDGGTDLMNFHILTLFPEMIEQGLNTSITGRAISNGLLSH